MFDEDQGPNTGGMGAYSPAPILTPALTERVMQEVMYPVVKGLQRRGITYKGILYAGLMIDKNNIKVLEFNVRFGDPECQPLMLRLKTDLVDVVEAVIAGRLAEISLTWDERPAVCVVLTAGGYPGTYETGQTIAGLESLRGWNDGVVFHAGTEISDHQYVTKGGRVLGVTATGPDIGGAIVAAYDAIRKITWPGMHYRRDIGQRALAYLKDNSRS